MSCVCSGDCYCDDCGLIKSDGSDGTCQDWLSVQKKGLTVGYIKNNCLHKKCINKDKLKSYLTEQIDKFYKLDIKESIKPFNLSSKNTLQIILDKLEKGEFK